MADIIQGMFGASPSQIMQDRDATGYAQDLRAVQLDPMQQANLMLRQGGRGLGQSVLAPMLGVEDQDLKKAQTAQQLASNFTITTPEGMMEYAQALAQNGMPEFAQIAVAKAQGMQKTGLDIQQSELNIKKTQQATDREEQLRAALAALPADATEEDYLRVYRQFGSADQQARILEMGVNTRAKLSAKQEEQEKLNQSLKDDMLGNALEGKAYIEKLMPRVGTNTVGLVGGSLAYLPQSDAAAFASDLKELQSKLTMAVLGAAKAQSKTGATGFGALNMKELEVIKQNIADLDQMKLSPDEFKKKLNTVYAYFDKLEKKATGTYNPREEPAAGLDAREKKGQAQTGTPTAPAKSTTSTDDDLIKKYLK